MTAATVPIPQRLFGYAEVVVDADGVAHRPHSFQRQTGSYQRWNGDLEVMEDVPVYTLDYAPECLGVDGYTDADGNPHKDRLARQFSAAYAHHLGYAGCPVCFKEG